MWVISSIYLWAIGSALLACVAMLIAHKLVKPIDLTENQATLDATLNIVGTLVSILLGLLVAASLNNYQTLQTAVDAEAASVIEIVRLAFGLPTAQKKEILKTCLNYCNQVVDDEWAAMQRNSYSENTVKCYVQLVTIIVTFKPANNGETNIHSALITAMQSLGDYRRGRILWLNNNWIKNLMPVLIMCSVIVLIFAYLYVKRGSVLLHGFLICFVAMALGANLGLMYVLSHPFRGDWKIEPRGFQFDIQVIKRYAN